MSKDELNSKKSTNQNILSRRISSTEFKHQKVAELKFGKISIANFVNYRKLGHTLFTVGFTNILQNTKKQRGSCLTTMVNQLDSEATKTQALLPRISELAHILNQKNGYRL